MEDSKTAVATPRRRRRAPKTPAAALRDERREVAEIERKQPLRRRLLEALGEEPSVPSELAKVVRARKESVSRKLAELREEGLVVDEQGNDDRRHNVYSLTLAGRSELSRHFAFGKDAKLPPPRSDDEAIEFLREALTGAVAMRRRTNRLQDAIDRLEEIRVQANELGAHEVALEALAELTTTQRQDRQKRAAKRSLNELETIAFGTSEIRKPDLVMPAIAHLEYERGRVGEMRGEDAVEMAPHLNAAISLFGQLAEHRPKRDTRALRNRQAWSYVSLARSLRRQSQYEASLRYAAHAQVMFDELEDDYGRVQCLYLFGFGLRLLRRFDEAWHCLDQAHKISCDPANGFERSQSSCLMQMGDVRRLQDETGDAKQMLLEAVELADRMDLVLTKAFATSAIGAVEYQERDFEQAKQTLGSAQACFEKCAHLEGTALNARRQATVARRLSFENFKMSVKEAKAVKALLRLAVSSYQAIGSPAGVAACEVERGWMRTLAPDCGDVEPVLKRLDKILNEDRAWRSLKRDAWFPEVFNTFAKQVDDEKLTLQAEEVYAASKEQLEESSNQGLEYVHEVAGRIRTSHESQTSERAIEMGGESRLQEQAVAA